MATDDELAKQRVQEAVWEWTQRLLVLAVTFGFGYFAAWVFYGYGPDGAPALRDLRTKHEAEIVDRKNRQVDIEGQLTVVQGKLTGCQSDLQKARTSLAAAQSAAQAAGRPAE
ncbi:MAG: hypothetical protein KIT14_05265 [bacterium]|nr:hypothetical protein [bacterium]